MFCCSSSQKGSFELTKRLNLVLWDLVFLSIRTCFLLRVTILKFHKEKGKKSPVSLCQFCVGEMRCCFARCCPDLFPRCHLLFLTDKTFQSGSNCPETTETRQGGPGYSWSRFCSLLERNCSITFRVVLCHFATRTHVRKWETYTHARTHTHTKQTIVFVFVFVVVILFGFGAEESSIWWVRLQIRRIRSRPKLEGGTALSFEVFQFGEEHPAHKSPPTGCSEKSLAMT